MKIGIDIRLIGKKRTGDEVVFFNLVKNLARIDSENEYRLLTDEIDENKLLEIRQRLEIERKQNFQVVSLGKQNKFSWNFWSLAKYLRKNPVDVFETQYITPWFVSRKIKIITIIHDISFNFFPGHIKFLDLLFLRLLIPISLKRADRVVAVSEFTKNEIEKYYQISEEKIEVIFNAVSEDFLRQDVSQSKLEQVKKKYELPDKFLLYMGTLQPRKNLPFFIEAFAKIKQQIPDLKLVIAGNLKAHNVDLQIENKIKQLSLENEVMFPGFVDEDDKAAIFALAHVFVFPSLYEGFGIPVLEAMSQGVPVVASDIESLKEIGSDCALFFDVQSLDNLAEKLYTVCMDQKVRERLIPMGKERVSFFSWEKSARKTIETYANLLHK
jgi:glycosyltransferase involved in cell wall biosynthesis